MDRKFDLRQFILVTSVDPLTIFIHDSPLLRFCNAEFSLKNFSQKNSHITNWAVQKSSLRWPAQLTGGRWSISQFRDFLSSIAMGNVYDTRILPVIRKIAIMILRAMDKSSQRERSFRLFSVDFMLTDMLNPMLLEINSNPGFTVTKQYMNTLSPAIYTMVNDTISVVLNASQTWAVPHALPGMRVGSWEMIYRGETYDDPSLDFSQFSKDLDQHFQD